MAIYVGKIPFPLPYSSEYELRDNEPFKSLLVVLRRPKYNKFGCVLVDGDGRRFDLFYRDFLSLEKVLGRLDIGSRIAGKWVFHKKGRYFGILALEVKPAGEERYRKVPIHKKRYPHRKPRINEKRNRKPKVIIVGGDT